MIIVALLFNLVIFGLLIFGIKKIFSSKSKHIQKEGAVRRFFQLGLLFGLTIISAVGVSGLIGRLLRIGEPIFTDRGNLAMESAFTLVGLPLLTVVAIWTRNSIRQDPEEAHTFIWNLYLTAISILSLGLTIDGAANVLGGLFTDDLVRGKDISQLVIWGLLWAFHFRLHNKLVRSENTLGEHIIGSLIGLAFSVVGLIVVFSALVRILLPFDQDSLLVIGENQLVNGLITLFIGSVVWGIYWVGTAQKAVKESLWYAYVLLVGVGGGLLTTVISASLLLDTVLVWFFGESKGSAQTYFQGTPTLIGATLTGGIVLWYHRLILNSQEIARTVIRRIYEYGISAIGLLAASGGVTMILVSIIESLSRSSQLSGPSSINTLIGAVTLIIVGGPVWSLQWRSIQNRSAEDLVVEKGSIVRRVYLLLLFGVVGVTAVVVLLTTAYLVFYDLFNGNIGVSTFTKIRFPVAIFLTAAVVSIYHWNIYRSEKDIQVRRETKQDNKVIFFVEINLKPRTAAKVIDVLNKYAVHVRKENGCERIDVLVDPKSKTRIYLYEVWSSAQSHDEHMTSEGFAGWKSYSDPLIQSFDVKTLNLAEAN
jgi:quinol monooxygenase YgiN